MAPHPLDISGILQSKGIPSGRNKPKAEEPNGSSSRPKEKRGGRTGENPSSGHVHRPVHGSERLERNAQPSEDLPPVIKIKSEFWSLLNEESRRMLTSRIWRGVDFNPMLAELEDISKLTEKWLKWAVPTYVNGLKGGPIKDWLDGQRVGKDFHYVLVGEHLKHLKEMRQKNKVSDVEGGQDPVVEDAVPASSSAQPHEEELVSQEKTGEEDKAPLGDPVQAPGDSGRLASSLEALDENIAWFQAYLEKQQREN